MKYYIGQKLKTRQNVLTVTGVTSKYIYTEYTNDFGTCKDSQKIEVLNDMINSGKIEVVKGNYSIRYKATKRVAQALADALDVPLKPYNQFYIPMLGRYAKTQREQVEALLDLVNAGLVVNYDVIADAKYSDGTLIFKF